MDPFLNLACAPVIAGYYHKRLHLYDPRSTDKLSIWNKLQSDKAFVSFACIYAYTLSFNYFIPFAGRQGRGKDYVKGFSNATNQSVLRVYSCSLSSHVRAPWIHDSHTLNSLNIFPKAVEEICWVSDQSIFQIRYIDVICSDFLFELSPLQILLAKFECKGFTFSQINDFNSEDRFVTIFTDVSVYACHKLFIEEALWRIKGVT